MFRIKIAGIAMGIENRYPYIRHLSADYLEEEEEPAFVVSASKAELLREQEKDQGKCALPYAESLCILRKICSQLIAYDAFLMHSAVIAVDSEAYVFAAKSGMGKTTHIKLWMKEFGAHAQVVNGDKPIFRFIDGRLYACGTPWRGKEQLGSNMMCPVKAISFLEQSGSNQICMMEEAEIIGRIFHQLLVPRDEKDVICFMDMVGRMISTIPFYLLRCNMDRQAALEAYRAMSRASRKD